MIRPSVAAATLCAATLALISLASAPAQAQFFSNKDGYAPDGSYRVQVELTHYVWLPAVSGSVHLASPRASDVISGNFSSGFPSASTLANSLHGALHGRGSRALWTLLW